MLNGANDTDQPSESSGATPAVLRGAAAAVRRNAVQGLSLPRAAPDAVLPTTMRSGANSVTRRARWSLGALRGGRCHRARRPGRSPGSSQVADVMSRSAPLVIEKKTSF